MVAVPGFACQDPTYVFQSDGPVYCKRVQKTPYQNLYTYLPHPLLDPYEKSVGDRLDRFYAQSFFQNHVALEVQYAMILLAIAGENIDRAWWSVGKGGVGQSLNSHHIAALFGALHGFLDMNIYFSDDELRKQGDFIAGKKVVTGQECVHGQKMICEKIYTRSICLQTRLPSVCHM